MTPQRPLTVLASETARPDGLPIELRITSNPAPTNPTAMLDASTDHGRLRAMWRTFMEVSFREIGTRPEDAMTNYDAHEVEDELIEAVQGQRDFEERLGHPAPAMVSPISWRRAENGAVTMACDLVTYPFFRMGRTIFRSLRPDAKARLLGSIIDRGKIPRVLVPSFGLSVMATACDEHDADQRVMVVALRERNAATNGRRWHPTINEGITTDDVTNDGTVDLRRAGARGFEEEMALQVPPDRLVARALFLTFDDVNGCDFGAVSHADLPIGFREAARGPSTAMDGHEIERFRAVPMVGDDIERELEEMTQQVEAGGCTLWLPLAQAVTAQGSGLDVELPAGPWDLTMVEPVVRAVA